MKDYISPLKTDYVSKYDDKPRTELIDMITEPPHRVLEIGCGAGAKTEIPGNRICWS